MDLGKPMSQVIFGEMVGISQAAVSELVTRGVLTKGASATTWLLEYCDNLREQASGRQADNGMNLASERARLSRAQAELAEMTLRERRRELVSVAGLEARLSANIIAAREFLLQQPRRLALLMDGMDRKDIEDLLAKNFEDFLRRIASINGADEDEDDDD